MVRKKTRNKTTLWIIIGVLLVIIVANLMVGSQITGLVSTKSGDCIISEFTEGEKTDVCRDTNPSSCPQGQTCQNVEKWVVWPVWVKLSCECASAP